jgi:hypothetical protein
VTLTLSLLVEMWTTAADPTLANLVTRAAPAGDVNGDGLADVFLLDSDSFGDNTTGTVRLHFGSPAGLASAPGWTAPRNAWSDAAVLSVAGAGDVNGDGYHDVILGVPGAVHPSGHTGLVVVLHGGPAGPVNEVAWSIESAQVELSGFGASVDTAGDVNGDGFDDVLVGAWADSTGMYYAGRAWLYLGSATGLAATPAWTAGGGVEWDTFGTDVTSAGDVNGDGFGDIAVGSSCDWTQEPTGRVEVFLGGPAGPPTTSDWSYQADVMAGHVCTQLGNDMASAGDVNGDGYDDLVAGAPYQSRPGEFSSFEGSAALFLGSPDGLGVEPAWFVIGDGYNAAFGRSVASAGDVDGDTYDDVVVGAPLDSDPTVSEGRVFLYLGGPAGLVPAPAWTHGSDVSGAQFGMRVTGVGDVDADGLHDVLVYGAGHFDGTTGAAWVFAGTGDCASGPDEDGDGLVDVCDLCAGDDSSGDLDGDRWCVQDVHGEALDCDDADPNAHPEGVEVCDGADNNCLDSVPDEERDLDGDGVYPCGGDCNDADSAMDPYLDEFCGDGLDNNCDGAVDESCDGDDTGCTCAATPTAPWWLFAMLAVSLRRRPSRGRADS